MTNDYTNKLDKLFDICACKCKTKCHIHINCDETCTEMNVDCKCPRSDKVSKDELPFLLDQGTVRKMFIAGVDVKTTDILRVRGLRKKSTKQGEEKIKSKRNIDQQQPLLMRKVYHLSMKTVNLQNLLHLALTVTLNMKVNNK